MYQIHGHPDGEPFRSDREYLMASRCWVCKAAPGEPCNAPNKGGRSHTVRQDAARNWELRDHGSSPYPEDRVPGQCYSTLPGCE